MIRLLPVLLLAACAPPDVSDLFLSADERVAADAASGDAVLVDVVDSAEDELHVALPFGQTTDVSDAVLRAFDRGVDVQVLTDIDREGDPGIAALIDAGVPVRLADGAFTYFDFTANTDVAWTSDQVHMSDAWAVADHQRVALATLAGSDLPGPRVVLDARGEELAEDILSEFNQLFGGTDATALTAFSNPAKSLTDLNETYPTTDEARLGVWFGPQERLTKRVIDAVYAARSSVRILTDDLSNEGLARALQEKAANGFPVTVITGPSLGLGSSVQARVYQNEAPDVDKLTLTGAGAIPTIILIDFEPTRLDQRSLAKAMAISHDLQSAAKIYKGSEVESDQVIDGVMWSLETTKDPSPAMNDLLDLFEAQLALAQEL